MNRNRRRISCLAALVCLLVSAGNVDNAWADESRPDEPRVDGPRTESLNLPTLKFFYFDAPKVEWIVSEDPPRFQQHLASNSDSQTLLDAATAAIGSTAESNNSATQMNRWIASERTRFDQARREPARLRMAEGVIAYLRDHDFDIQKLVDALKRRSGASNVELVVVHLRDRQNAGSFKLKVVLVDPSIKIGKQGFNIDLPGPNANYTTVAYALGVALYYVQEIIHGEPAPGGSKQDDTIEQLPAPEPVDARVSNEQPSPTAG